MRLTRTKEFEKYYKKLPASVKKQVNKQVVFLSQNFRHPSLKSRKMGGSNTFEARVSRGYRIRYQIVNDSAILLTIGQHDAGLGKK